MNFRTPQPIFIQIAHHIIELIISKEWIAGERIPSVRHLASDIEVNPNTVARTYTLLGQEGIIHTTRGVGYFLDDNAVALATDYLKKQFVEDELPHLLKMLDVLNLSLEDLKNNKNEKKKK